MPNPDYALASGMRKMPGSVVSRMGVCSHLCSAQTPAVSRTTQVMVDDARTVRSHPVGWLVGLFTWSFHVSATPPAPVARSQRNAPTHSSLVMVRPWRLQASAQLWDRSSLVSIWVLLGEGGGGLREHAP